MTKFSLVNHLLLGLMISPLLSTKARLRVPAPNLKIREARRDNDRIEKHSGGIRKLNCGDLLSIAVDSDKDSSGGLNIDEFYLFLYGICPGLFSGDESQGDPGFFRTRVFYRDGLFEVYYWSSSDDAPPHFAVFFKLVDVKNVEENEVIEVSLTRARQVRSSQSLFCDSIFDALEGYLVGQNSKKNEDVIELDGDDETPDRVGTAEDLIGGLTTSTGGSKSATINTSTKPKSTTIDKKTVTKTTATTTTAITTISAPSLEDMTSDEITTQAAAIADGSTSTTKKSSSTTKTTITESANPEAENPVTTEPKVTTSKKFGAGSTTTTTRGVIPDATETTVLNEITIEAATSGNSFVMSTMNSDSTKPNKKATTTEAAIPEAERLTTGAPHATTTASTAAGTEQTKEHAETAAASATMPADETKATTNASSTKPKTNEATSLEIKKPTSTSSTTEPKTTTTKSTEVSSETEDAVTAVVTTAAPAGKPKDATTTITPTSAETTKVSTSKASKTTTLYPTISKHTTSTGVSYFRGSSEAEDTTSSTAETTIVASTDVATTTAKTTIMPITASDTWATSVAEEVAKQATSSTTTSTSRSKTTDATSTSTNAANDETTKFTTSSHTSSIIATTSLYTGSYYTTTSSKIEKSEEAPMGSSHGKRIRDETDKTFIYSGEFDSASTERHLPSDGVIVGVFAAIAVVILLIVLVVIQHPFFNPREQRNQ